LVGLSAWTYTRDYAKVSGIDKLVLGYGAAFGGAMFIIGLIGWCTAKHESRILIVIVFFFIFTRIKVFNSNYCDNSCLYCCLDYCTIFTEYFC